MSKYPRRESHFAHRFTRLLFTSGAAAEIGLDGIALCVNIAHLEDGRRYQGPIRLWNAHLESALMGSESKIRRIRDRCVEAGWLHYERDTNRSIGYYWVTIPPEVTEVGASDNGGETEAEATPPPRINPVKSEGIPDGIEEGIPSETKGFPADSRRDSRRNHGGTSNPNPVPSPKPKKQRGSFPDSECQEAASDPAKPAKFDPLGVPLPYKSDRFREAWRRWVIHREETKTPLTPQAVKVQLQKLAEMSEANAVVAIDNSISSGWRGIFRPNGKQAESGSQHRSAPKDLVPGAWNEPKKEPAHA